MSRLTLIDPANATGERRQLLDAIHGAFGATPAMFRTVAHSPAALRAMWSAFGALGGGTLGARLGEQIAVRVADLNGCAYCLAAHTALGRKAGASAEEMAAAQAGESADPRTQAALRFAGALVERRGHVHAQEVQALRDAGFDEEATVEILAHVALNLFTNYVNVAFDVPVDFPAVALRRPAPVAA
ncbi:carboxymuconolactone decarboxylase family protein [Ideonella sp.]|uniref:carboxymuconolactone decarboxylase family protein n=1 Tax=Ideonella sp. TaxID=1929293 RepID=UPI0035AF0D66